MNGIAIFLTYAVPAIALVWSAYHIMYHILLSLEVEKENENKMNK